jgi:hypothetical protein
MDGENCSFMLRDRVTGELFTHGARGKSEVKSVYYSDHSADGRKFRLGEGVAGWVLKEGQGMMVNDVTKEPRFVMVGNLNDKVISDLFHPGKGSGRRCLQSQPFKERSFGRGRQIHSWPTFQPGWSGFDCCPFFSGNPGARSFEKGPSSRRSTPANSFPFHPYKVEMTRITLPSLPVKKMYQSKEVINHGRYRCNRFDPGESGWGRRWHAPFTGIHFARISLLSKGAALCRMSFWRASFLAMRKEPSPELTVRNSANLNWPRRGRFS